MAIDPKDQIDLNKDMLKAASKSERALESWANQAGYTSRATRELIEDTKKLRSSQDELAASISTVSKGYKTHGANLNLFNENYKTSTARVSSFLSAFKLGDAGLIGTMGSLMEFTGGLPGAFNNAFGKDTIGMLEKAGIGFKNLGREMSEFEKENIKLTKSYERSVLSPFTDMNNRIKSNLGRMGQGLGKFAKRMRSSGVNKSFSRLGLSMSRFGVGVDAVRNKQAFMNASLAALGGAADVIKNKFGDDGVVALGAFKDAGMATDDQLQKIAQRSLALGGKPTAAISQIVNIGEKLGAQYGLTAKSLSKDISSMMGDVGNFGNMSVQEMGTAAAYARKLGTDISQLQGVIGKFDNFAEAAQNAAKLSQAFGANVDAVKMMNEEDPSKRVGMLRDSLFAAGKSAEKMTRQELNLLAAQTGLDASTTRLVFSQKNRFKGEAALRRQMEKSAKDQKILKNAPLETARAMRTLSKTMDTTFVELGDRLEAIMESFMMSTSGSKFYKAMRNLSGASVDAASDVWKGFAKNPKIQDAMMKFYGVSEGWSDKLKKLGTTIGNNLSGQAEGTSQRLIASNSIETMTKYYKESGDTEKGLLVSQARATRGALLNELKSASNEQAGVIKSQIAELSKLIPKSNKEKWAEDKQRRIKESQANLDELKKTLKEKNRITRKAQGVLHYELGRKGSISGAKGKARRDLKAAQDTAYAAAVAHHKRNESLTAIQNEKFDNKSNKIDPKVVEEAHATGIDAGKGLQQGFQEGSLLEMPTTTYAIVEALDSSMRNALEMHSPSRKAIPWGEGIMLGIIQGVANLQPTFEGNMTALTSPAAINAKVTAAVGETIHQLKIETAPVVATINLTVQLDAEQLATKVISTEVGASSNTLAMVGVKSGIPLTPSPGQLALDSASS